MRGKKSQKHFINKIPAFRSASRPCMVHKYIQKCTARSFCTFMNTSVPSRVEDNFCAKIVILLQIQLRTSRLLYSLHSIKRYIDDNICILALNTNVTMSHGISEIFCYFGMDFFRDIRFNA